MLHVAHLLVLGLGLEDVAGAATADVGATTQLLAGYPIRKEKSNKMGSRVSELCLFLSCNIPYFLFFSFSFFFPSYFLAAEYEYEIKENKRTYGDTSCIARVSAGSTFFAMLPVPPLPVVTTEVLSVGVSRSLGSMRGDLVLSTMLPAPPLPEDVNALMALFGFAKFLFVSYCR